MSKMQNSYYTKNRFVYSVDDGNKSATITYSTNPISLISTNIDSVFSEKWNPEITRNVTFFKDFDLPVSFFPINSIRNIIQNLILGENCFKAKNILEDKVKSYLTKDFRDCSLYSLGISKFSNGYLRFMIICCSKGVIIIDTSLINNNNYYNDHSTNNNNNNEINSCIHDFLRFINNSAEVVGTNFSSSLHIVESLYQVKLGIRDIDTVDNYINFLRSAQIGPNWKTICTHQVHDFPSCDASNFDPNGLFSVLDVISIAHRTVASYYYSTNVCDDSAVFIAQIPNIVPQSCPIDQLKHKEQPKITIERPDEDKKKKGFIVNGNIITTFNNKSNTNANIVNEALKNLNSNDVIDDHIKKEEQNLPENTRLPFTLPVSAPASNDSTSSAQTQKLTLIPNKNLFKSSDSGVSKSNDGSSTNSGVSSNPLQPAPFSLLPNAMSHTQTAGTPLSLLPSAQSKKPSSQQPKQTPLTNLILPNAKSSKEQHLNPTPNNQLNLNVKSSNASNPSNPSAPSNTSSASSNTQSDAAKPSNADSSINVSSDSAKTSTEASNAAPSSDTSPQASAASPKSAQTSAGQPASSSAGNSPSHPPLNVPGLNDVGNKDPSSYMMTTKSSPRRQSQDPPRMQISMIDKENQQQQQQQQQSQAQPQATTKNANSVANPAPANGASNQPRNNNFTYSYNRNNNNNPFVYTVSSKSNNNSNNNNNNNNNPFVYNASNSNRNTNNNNNPFVYTASNSNNNNNNNQFVYNASSKNSSSSGGGKNRNNSFNEKFHYRSPSVDNETQASKTGSDSRNANYNSSSTYNNNNNNNNNRRFGQSSSNNRFFYSKSNSTETSNNSSTANLTSLAANQETAAKTSENKTEAKEKTVVIETKEKEKEEEKSLTVVNDDFWSKLRSIEASLAAEGAIQSTEDGFICKKCDVIISKSFSNLMRHCWECHNNE